MHYFFHQSLLSMADTFEKATGENLICEDLRDYCYHFAEKIIEKLKIKNWVKRGAITTFIFYEIKRNQTRSKSSKLSKVFIKMG